MLKPAHAAGSFAFAGDFVGGIVSSLPSPPSLRLVYFHSFPNRKVSGTYKITFFLVFSSSHSAWTAGQAPSAPDLPFHAALPSE